MAEETDTLDPRGLIRESYRIEGISAEECRSIFMDWALGIPEGADMRQKVIALYERHKGNADHPMTRILRDGVAPTAPARRRGGRAGRRG